MAWTALTYGVGSLLTSTKMTQLQANFTALADNESGAPTIVPQAIDPSKPATANVSQYTVPTGTQAIGPGWFIMHLTSTSGVSLQVSFDGGTTWFTAHPNDTTPMIMVGGNTNAWLWRYNRTGGDGIIEVYELS